MGRTPHPAPRTAHPIPKPNTIPKPNPIPKPKPKPKPKSKPHPHPHPNQVALARRLRPRRTLLVGMGHAMEHHATNRRLRRLWSEEGLDVQLAYDGQFVPLEF